MTTENKTSATALARAVGVTRQTIYDWRKREGFPLNGSADDVKAWADANGLQRVYITQDTGNLAELKAQSLQRDIALKDVKLAAMRGDVVDRAVVKAMLRLLGSKLDLLLRLKLEVELGPRVAGKSAAEANVEGSLILDEIREVVNANLARFETDAVKQSKSGAGSDEEAE